MYIATVETDKGEIICSFEEREAYDIDTRLLADRSKRAWEDWIKERKELFPHFTYRIYRLIQVGLG